MNFKILRGVGVHLKLVSENRKILMFDLFLDSKWQRCLLIIVTDGADTMQPWSKFKHQQFCMRLRVALPKVNFYVLRGISVHLELL